MARTIITHDGKFHADDVFSVAALLLYEPDAKVVRTRAEDKINKGDIVVDVGGVYDEQKERFDHHQEEVPPIRDNGVSYASFGMIWKKIGEKLCGDSAVAKRVEDILVIPIDANDNGIDLSLPTIPNLSPYEISDIIRSCNPTWREEDNLSDIYFDEAVSLAKRIIGREIKRAEAIIIGQAEIKKIYASASDKRIIILPEDYSWKDALAKFPEPLYVVHPQNGGWRLYCVRDNPRVFTNRKDLPLSWAGLRDEALARETGVRGAVFAHRNRFMAATRTKEGALALARLALNSDL